MARKSPLKSWTCLILEGQHVSLLDDHPPADGLFGMPALDVIPQSLPVVEIPAAEVASVAFLHVVGEGGWPVIYRRPAVGDGRPEVGDGWSEAGDGWPTAPRRGGGFHG